MATEPTDEAIAAPVSTHPSLPFWAAPGMQFRYLKNKILGHTLSSVGVPVRQSTSF